MSFGQSTIQFVDGPTNRPVPFLHVTGPDFETLSDVDGLVVLDSVNYPITLKVKGYFHTTHHFTISQQPESVLQLRVEEPQRMLFLNYTDPITAKLVKRIHRNKTKNNPNSLAPFTYNTYNKFFLFTDQLDSAKGMLNKALSLLSLKIKDFPKDHHLMLSESVTQRRYKNKLNEKENILSSKVSGVDKPLLLSMNSQIQSLSLYEDYIMISGSNYVNPIAGKDPLKLYRYKVVDTINLKNDQLYVLQFNPRKWARFESLKGFFFVSAKNHAIVRALIRPAIESSVLIEVVHLSEAISDTTYFPKVYYTNYDMPEVTRGMSFRGVMKTFIREVEFESHFTDNEFGEIAIQYKKPRGLTQESFWAANRAELLTKADSNTYAFYDSVGTIKNFERVINLGERLYQNRIPFKLIDFEINRFAAYNEYEGVRLGIGGETNHKLTEHAAIGGFYGYGFRDNMHKYELHLKLKAPILNGLSITGSLGQDVHESGQTFHAYDEFQYSSESLRKISVRLMDIHSKIRKIELQLHPINYLDLSVRYQTYNNSIRYNYSHFNDSLPQYDTKELSVNAHYRFGQRYFKLLHEKYAFESVYPKIWLQLNTGSLSNGSRNISYTQLNLKANYFYKFLSLGTTGIQFNLGLASKDLPYFRLYNGQGSQGNTAVVHNSFETMGYNEFLSNQYVALFVSHDFGYSHFLKYKNFKPRAELAFNTGWGRLTNSLIHSGIEFSTMEKVYLEAGASINNLIIVSAYGLKAGFGIGFYHRFGAHRLNGFTNNSLFKVSTTYKF